MSGNRSSLAVPQLLIALLLTTSFLSSATVAAPATSRATNTTPNTNTNTNTNTTAVVVPADVSAQTLAFTNARLALRDGRPKDVLQLWLLRNALKSAGHTPTHDDDFRSVVWAALGELGYCADGFIEDGLERPLPEAQKKIIKTGTTEMTVPVDTDTDTQPGTTTTKTMAPGRVGGAGLWPLALHNWLLKNVAKPAPEQPDPWTSFQGGMQQRRVSLHDVLSLEELKTVRFFRAFCLMPWTQQPRIAEQTHALQWVDMDDRLSAGLMMRELIDLAEMTLVDARIEGRALLATRRFDLDVALTKMQATRARQKTALTDQLLRDAGVSPGGRLQMERLKAEAFGLSDEAKLWRAAMTWSTTEWLSLSSTRRLSLFADIDKGLDDPAGRARVITGLVDALAARGDGAEVTAWLGFAGRFKRVADADDVDSRFGDPERTRLLASLVDGERGERLLALTPAQGFRERSAVALHRGVTFLKAGETLSALRSFAVALAQADDSTDVDTVRRLAQRWLAFILSQYGATAEVIGIVDRFVPTIDYSIVVETLVWRAAFHGDTASMELLQAAAKRRKSSAVLKLTTQLDPLTRGDPGALFTTLSTSGQSDASIARFMERLLDQLALEPIDVRRHHRRTLELAVEVLLPMVERASPSQRKRIAVLLTRAQALRDAVGDYDDSIAGRLDAVSPDKEAYAGSVRLAPADPLPWPFVPPLPAAPNPFAPIKLVPVEWRDADGALTFGWSLRDGR